jgi:3-hydroxyisobutyrate dehydrogenase-like beta-hydroxyacid dehydrogenase
MKVGWIGLGHMGLPTAKRVAAAGHPVTGYDVRPPTPADAERLQIVDTPRAAAEGCDLLCIAVFSDEQVEELLLGPEGLFSVLAPGAVVAVFTTGTIASARRLAAAAPNGVAVLDTCFSRQVAMIPSGELNLLVGGEAEALDRCRPALAAFARTIHHVGPSGAGRAIKLVNNLLWVAHNQIDMDARRFAEGLGLDADAALRVILECSGANDSLNVFARPSWRQTYDFMQPYMVKDASAAAQAARDAGVDLGGLGAAAADFIRDSETPS